MSSFPLNMERMTKVETIAERKSFSLSVVSRARNVEKVLMVRMMYLFFVVMAALFFLIVHEMDIHNVFRLVIIAEMEGLYVANNYFCSRAETISSVTFLASPYSMIVLSAKNSGFSTPE